MWKNVEVSPEILVKGGLISREKKTFASIFALEVLKIKEICRGAVGGEQS
ncbi:hypothetical protein [Natrinema salsiterrestre]|uniref:Uncharacterized protein n=1 Tax=Natrinema salsiterrestre TaxID=2950540 RepID=A0A9Q4L411_9EURY|nr:hypothetical protein [Natrinema salsiterrestre]MDF9747189.1 hypothetical protein [Natrinema salsiterrestre]